MFEVFSVTCPSCKKMVHIRSEKFHTLRARVAYLEALLKHHNIHYDEGRNEYGKHLDHFLITSTLPKSVLEREHSKPIPLEDKTGEDKDGAA